MALSSPGVIGRHVVQLCHGDCVVDIERCFPLSRSGFDPFEEFRFVDVPSRLAFRHPLGFEDPGLVIGDLLVRKAVRIGQVQKSGSGVPDPPIENVTTMPAPFVVSRPDPALAANRDQLQCEALLCNHAFLTHSSGPDDSCWTLLLIHLFTD